MAGAVLYETKVVREKIAVSGLMMPDHHAIIGDSDIKSVYFCNGFSGHGVMHSPVPERAIAEIIPDRKFGFLDVSSLSLKKMKQARCFANQLLFRKRLAIEFAENTEKK